MESGKPDERSTRLFWSLLAAVTATDYVTKWFAERELAPLYRAHEVAGDWLRLTLVYNPGAAFGLHLGPYSRWIFLVLTLLALVILGRLFRATCPGDTRRIVAIALVCGGALGNLIDRIRSPQGVVDFLDVGVGYWRWPTFNVADVAVSVGAFLLAWALWGEDEAAAAAGEPALAPVEEPVAVPLERTGT